MAHEPEVRIVVGSDLDADPSDMARWTEQLNTQFMAIGLRTSRPSEAGLPDGAKSSGATLTQLMVTLTSSSVLVAVVQTVKAFVTRAKGSRIRIELDGDVLELQDGTDEERHIVIEAWQARQQRRLDTPPHQP